MHETTRAYLRRLLDHWVEQLDDQALAELLQQAQHDAMAQVRQLLTEMMVPCLLERLSHRIPEPMSVAESEPVATAAATDPIAKTAKMAEEPEEEPDDSYADTLVVSSSHAYYIYGIIEYDEQHNPTSIMCEQPVLGVEPSMPIWTIACGSLHALVSRVPLDEFGHTVIDDQMQQLEWLEAKVRAHHDVIAWAHERYPILPFRFGTIYEHEERIHDLLHERYDEFAAMLSQVRGTNEWGIKAWCDTAQLQQHIETHHERVRGLDTEIETKSAGMAYFLRKQRASLITEQVQQQQDTIALESHRMLASVAAQATMTTPNQHSSTPDMVLILQSAYLVFCDQEAAFDAQLRHLESIYGSIGVRYDITGPWPPYSFVGEQFARDIHEKGTVS